MPLEITQFPLDSDHIGRLTSVLRDNDAIAEQLSVLLQADANPDKQLWVGIFNAKPVSLALLEKQNDQWQVSQLVVHPATRGRGVGAETLRLTALQQPFQHPPALRVLAQRAGLSEGSSE